MPTLLGRRALNSNFVNASIKRLLGARQSIVNGLDRDRRSWRKIPDVLAEFLYVERIPLCQLERSVDRPLLVIDTLTFGRDHQGRSRGGSFKRSDSGKANSRSASDRASPASRGIWGRPAAASVTGSCFWDALWRAAMSARNSSSLTNWISSMKNTMPTFFGLRHPSELQEQRNEIIR